MSDVVKNIIEQIVKMLLALICKNIGCCKDCSEKGAEASKERYKCDSLQESSLHHIR